MIRRLFCFLLLALACAAQTLTFTGPASARPGETITLNLLLGAAGSSIAALQWDTGLPPGFAAKAVTGTATTEAGKTLVCNPSATRCLAYGVNTSVYAGGVVATYQVLIPTSQPAGAVSFPLSGLIAAQLDGSAGSLSAGPNYSVTILANSDLNGDGATDVQDIQILIDVILGPIAANCPVPQNADLICNVLDLQIVARAAVGA